MQAAMSDNKFKSDELKLNSKSKKNNIKIIEQWVNCIGSAGRNDKQDFEHIIGSGLNGRQFN